MIFIVLCYDFVQQKAVMTNMLFYLGMLAATYVCVMANQAINVNTYCFYFLSKLDLKVTLGLLLPKFF